jgi:hypothetical protein
MSMMDLGDLSFYGVPTDQPVFGVGAITAGAGEDRYWKFLSKDQRCRLEKLRQARMLFNGMHREYFLLERRTQFKFPVARIPWMWGDQDHQIYETYNVLGMASTKGADLLFGDEPILRVAAPKDLGDGPAIRVQEEAQRSFLAELVDRCDLAALFHQKAEDASCDGEIYLEGIVQDGEVWLTDVRGEEIFPVGPLRPDRQYAAYDRYTVTRIPPPANTPNAVPVDLLLITHYKIGSIERECWKLHNGEKESKISLDQWPIAEGEAPLQEKVATGIDANTIVCIPNQIRHGKTVNDYRGAEPLQDALNAKMSQVNWILAMHSQPKISRHSRHATPDGTMASDYAVEYNDDQGEASKYITWDGQLAAAQASLEFTLLQLCVKLEVSPVLLGISVGGNINHATAFKSFRLMATNALAKAARKAKYWKAGIRRALSVCSKLANTLPGVKFTAYPVGVSLRDGIPLDALEEAQRITTLAGGRATMSLKRAVNEQIPDSAQAQDEIDEIRAEEAAATPSVLMAQPTAGGAAGEEATTEGGETTGEEEDEARGEEQNDLDVAA